MKDSEWWRTFFDEDYVTVWTAAGVFEESAAQAEDIAASLPPDRLLEILDIPCGFGRISARLHERGHAVTGVDLSADQLRIAGESHPGPVYVQGDMRSPPPGPFDVVLNLFSSFGYFSRRSDDLAALRAWFSVLRPGGTLIMDLMHRDGVAYALGRGQTPMSRSPIRETGVTDWVQGRRTATVHYGTISKSFVVWLYTATDLVEALQAIGFKTVDVSGDLRGATPFSPETRLVIRAVK